MGHSLEQPHSAAPSMQIAADLDAEPELHVQAAAATPAGGQGWPASLRSYVERSFAQKIPDQKKGALNVALKQIISDAQASLLAPVLLPDVHRSTVDILAFYAHVTG